MLLLAQHNMSKKYHPSRELNLGLERLPSGTLPLDHQLQVDLPGYNFAKYLQYVNCVYVCMYNLYFRLRNTEQHSHTVLGSIGNL